MTEVDLATARNHVQQFQEISRANEEALANLNNTYDEYKMTMDGQIARHEVCETSQTLQSDVHLLMLFLVSVSGLEGEVGSCGRSTDRVDGQVQ